MLGRGRQAVAACAIPPHSAVFRIHHAPVPQCETPSCVRGQVMMACFPLLAGAAVVVTRVTANLNVKTQAAYTRVGARPGCCWSLHGREALLLHGCALALMSC